MLRKELISWMALFFDGLAIILVAGSLLFNSRLIPWVNGHSDNLLTFSLAWFGLVLSIVALYCERCERLRYWLSCLSIGLLVGLLLVVVTFVPRAP
jgi:H+/Cl- antiporter ClcA